MPGFIHRDVFSSPMHSCKYFKAAESGFVYNLLYINIFSWKQILPEGLQTYSPPLMFPPVL